MAWYDPRTWIPDITRQMGEGAAQAFSEIVLWTVDHPELFILPVCVVAAGAGAVELARGVGRAAGEQFGEDIVRFMLEG